MEIKIIARRPFLNTQESSSGKRLRTNENIRAPQVRIVDQNDQMIGVVNREEAIKMAQNADLDLVEVSPDATPPVCKILDFGKYRYEQGKRERANKAKSKVAEVKEIRLGRSMKIDVHDIQIRVRQARKFLIDGHKVIIVQNFRGREMSHKDRGQERLESIAEELSDVSRIELPPREASRRMSMTLSPDKDRIKRYLELQSSTKEEIKSTENTSKQNEELNINTEIQ